ncbi:hypothetical protein EDD53_1189 [Pacificibacter maritimus]|uniref:Uncharacterized protein n=1 Tax=Pacificibacter maritimus TaxID=762213 RepID=A0A3N4VDX1_9RHOB|nr:hypothetical protein [Pacificibacter maritimus]RPE72050.1 hypothetical protein EDD53_1189 [Pacificibacter maritimus]
MANSRNKQRWHMLRDAGQVTLSRRLPVRFDFAAKTTIKKGATLRKGRIASNVRQDMWRALQHLRGFAPVVQVQVVGEDLEITAGGAVDGQFPQQQTESLVADVLDCADRRARWVRNAEKAGI